MPPVSSSDPSSDDGPFPDDLGGVASLLDITLAEYGPERVVATMPVTPDHHQPFGTLHGGVSVVLAETVASVGGFLAAPEGQTAAGLEVNANHVRPVRNGRLVAVSTPLHTGRSTHVWEVKIRRAADEALVCASRCTLAIVDRSDPPS